MLYLCFIDEHHLKVLIADLENSLPSWRVFTSFTSSQKVEKADLHLAVYIFEFAGRTLFVVLTKQFCFFFKQIGELFLFVTNFTKSSSREIVYLTIRFFSSLCAKLFEATTFWRRTLTCTGTGTRR